MAISSTAASSDGKGMPHLTFVLIGETTSIDVEPNNLLLDHDTETQVEAFSSFSYDSSGRHISVVNMLGLQNNDDVLLYQSVHAFISSIPNGQHISQYTTGMMWSKATFGKEKIPPVMTVVTHNTDEKCDSALQESKVMKSFSEKRYHTCIRSMSDAEEILSLSEKIDAMISERDPEYFCEQSIGKNGDQKGKSDDLPHKEEIKPGEKIEAESTVECGDGAEGQSLSCDDSREEKPENKTFQCEPKEEGVLPMDLNLPQQQSFTNPSEENGKKCQKEIETSLGRLHLQDKNQQMSSSEDFVKIGPPVKQTDIFEKDLVHAFLQRLSMLDYRARYIPVQQESSDVNDSQAFPMSETAVTDDDDLDALFTTSLDLDQSKQNNVHPMDVQMAIFHCSDCFLKQKMITKSSQCQYALPSLVPDPVTADIECPLWTFRQITKTWKIVTMKENSTIVTMKSMPVYKAETPSVSFFRSGSMSLSKSQSMNALINDRHNTFFHRNCPGSTKSRHLMNSVAEIAWYCPAGKPNDFFTDCIAFCNLHGDSLAIVRQRELSAESSSVIVVLVPSLEKNKESSAIISMLYKSSKPSIILSGDNESSAVQMTPQKYKMGSKERSQSDVSEELKEIIRSLLSGPHRTFQLETMANVSDIRVDEDEKVCQNGKSAAMEIVELVKSMDIAKIKDTFLPCQGQLWYDWCKINKELHNLKGHIEKEKSQKMQQLEEIRQKQCDVSNSKSMSLFIHSLRTLPTKDREFFSKWTQILIDALSTDDLSSILQKYDEIWSEVLALKRKHDKSAQLKNKQAELEQLSKKLQSATFGSEHIFREMGQIYEAHKSSKQSSGHWTEWTKYPKSAADSMISGHPMESMDGDAGHVPLTWISSLLQEVINKSGDQRVFVSSVSGVQSSGKSTMLNAMFGSQFAVSAGRCTKGAYMQSVKMSEEIKDKYKFDYLLVVDTEGSRALELAGNATLHHDNELATFVVGSGNMTLINIFGENPSDMQDVLQIVVQAFMRMKKVKLSPSCVFVHQNVTDIAAAEKNMDGKRRSQEKSDQMTQLAAKEEACDVQCFSDVIAFDVQKDVKYFAQLWEGSPPMAPPNPGYSESVHESKSIISSKASQSTGIPSSHFNAKIRDLWNALMNEHFVFSFKNTHEIAVYRKLEVQYGNWTWASRSEMSNIENQLYPRIEKGQSDKIELNYLYKEMGKTNEEVKKNMAAYFEDDKDKEMLVQWRGRFENKIKDFHEELLKGVKRKSDEVIQQNKARKMLDNKKTEFENKSLLKSKELAHQLKCIEADEEELKAQFNSVWSHWVKELTSDTKPIENINLEEDQLVVLQDLGIEWVLFDESKRNQRYKSLSETGNYLYYITQKKYQKLYDESQQSKEIKTEASKDTGGQSTSLFGRFQQWIGIAPTTEQHVEKNKSKNPFHHEEQKQIRSFIENIEKECSIAIKSKPVATRGYRSTYLQELAKNVKKRVTEFESGLKFTFKKEFTIDLISYVFDRAEGWLISSHHIYKKNNDVLTYLNNKKNEYYNIFSSYCKGSSSAVVFGEIMCEKLKVSAIEAVCNKTAVDIAGEMMCSFPAFSGNRSNLEKHVSTSLAEKEDFNSFITYIRNPRRQVESFIREMVKKYMFTTQKGKAEAILKKNVEDIIRVISQALFEATDEVKKKNGDIEMWVEEFSSKLKPKLTLNNISCQNFRDINNFDFLNDETEKGLKTIMTEMSKLSLAKVNDCRQKPEQILIDQLCDCCWERCPFCAAVCTNTSKDHSPEKHSVPFHRPNGVQGWHRKGKVDLVIDFCTTLVASDVSFYPDSDAMEAIPYKQYPTAGGKYASWSITADASMLAYWKWFVCRFQKQLEDYYDLKFEGDGEIPPEWNKFSKEDAKESSNEMCNL